MLKIFSEIYSINLKYLINFMCKLVFSISLLAHLHSIYLARRSYLILLLLLLQYLEHCKYQEKKLFYLKITSRIVLKDFFLKIRERKRKKRQWQVIVKGIATLLQTSSFVVCNFMECYFPYTNINLWH